MLVILRWESSIHTHGSFLQVPNILPPLCRRWCCFVDQTGNAEYLTHHTVLSGCDDDDVEDFPPFPSRLTTPETTETRIFSSRYSPLPLFCFFVRFFFCFSHTLTRSDLPISVTKSLSVFRFSRKEMSSFRKETPCTVSVPSPTRPRGESFSLINALSSYNTSFSHDLLCSIGFAWTKQW